jgi:hypothetical protein
MRAGLADSSTVRFLFDTLLAPLLAFFSFAVALSSLILTGGGMAFFGLVVAGCAGVGAFVSFSLQATRLRVSKTRS